jgi:hypothetical protein
MTIARFFHNFAVWRSQTKMKREMPSEKPTEEAPIEVHEASPSNGILQRLGQRVGTAVAVFVVVAASLLVFPNSSSGQEKEKPVLADSSGGKDAEPRLARIPVPKNVNKILGSENFEKVELKDGILRIMGVKKGDEYFDLKIDIRNIRKEIKESFGEKQMEAFPEQMPLGVIVSIPFSSGSYLIYPRGILLTYADEQGPLMKAVTSLDESKIFFHDGAIFVAKNGSIVATTPTTLLVITPKEVISVTYKASFGEVSNLKRPYIGRGTDDDHAELRDEVIKDEKGPIKLVMRLSSFEIEGIHEIPAFNSVPPETPLWLGRADTTVPVRIDSTAPVPIH